MKDKKNKNVCYHIATAISGERVDYLPAGKRATGNCLFEVTDVDDQKIYLDIPRATIKRVSRETYRPLGSPIVYTLVLELMDGQIIAALWPDSNDEKGYRKWVRRVVKQTFDMDKTPSLDSLGFAKITRPKKTNAR